MTDEKVVVPDTLGDALPREMARVRDELLPQYLSLANTPGVYVGFAVTSLRSALDMAAKAMAEGDVGAMLRAYEVLKGCE
jgi:hypothetical protein